MPNGAVAVAVGSERLKVSSNPPVPNPESGPSVCIVFKVKVLLVGARGIGMGCLMAAANAPMGAKSLAVAVELLCKMILG